MKKSNQIVGASLGSRGVSTPKKAVDIKTVPGASSIGPSDEFRTFWGNNVDASWFEGRRFVSPFVIFIVLLALLTFYLSGRLLFSPGEFEQIFTETTASSTESSEQVVTEAAKLEEEALGEEKIDSSKTKNENVQSTDNKDSEINSRKSSRSSRSKRR